MSCRDRLSIPPPRNGGILDTSGMSTQMDGMRMALSEKFELDPKTAAEITFSILETFIAQDLSPLEVVREAATKADLAGDRERALSILLDNVKRKAIVSNLTLGPGMTI